MEKEEEKEKKEEEKEEKNPRGPLCSSSSSSSSSFSSSGTSVADLINMLGPEPDMLLSGQLPVTETSSVHQESMASNAGSEAKPSQPPAALKKRKRKSIEEAIDDNGDDDDDNGSEFDPENEEGDEEYEENEDEDEDEDANGDDGCVEDRPVPTDAAEPVQGEAGRRIPRSRERTPVRTYSFEIDEVRVVQEENGKKRSMFKCPFVGCDRAYPKPWRLEDHICTHTGMVRLVSLLVHKQGPDLQLCMDVVVSRGRLFVLWLIVGRVSFGSLTSRFEHGVFWPPFFVRLD